jgi:hypothetical protein
MKRAKQARKDRVVLAFHHQNHHANNDHHAIQPSPSSIIIFYRIGRNA